MKTLLHIGLFLISVNSFGQFDKLTVDFYPSFITNSTLTIKKKSNGFTIQLHADKIKEKSFTIDSNLVELDSFLVDYRFKHKGAIDTIGEEKKIEDGDTVVSYLLSFGTDGINVYGKLKNVNDEKTFKFWSPDSGDKNHELIEILFKLMYEQFKSQESINYLEQLEQYFDFGLGLRKLNDNPLTYKLYGSISSNELEELYVFFDSLPIDKVVNIDMSNFNGMGTMFDEDFLELSETHDLIRWVNCSEGAKRTLKRAGINDDKYK